MAAHFSSRAVPRLCALALLLAFTSAGLARADAIQVPAQDAYLFGTARVIDGDTLEIAGNSIRLADIDAPPLSFTCGADEAGRPVPCGQRAALFLRELVGLSPVACIPEGRDSYTRDVAQCRVKEQDLGAAMVRAGWALASFGTRYVAEEAQAKADNAGLWGFPAGRAFLPAAPPAPSPAASVGTKP
ncbi:thermonuclease family protein [Aquabacter cavernae]|uniref:thermonuclease family protein n=1 Tax=Aquabacter cavernae TaxID=2496029 RepID=UPI000F8D9D20|nr:thermonuclease family protein [Aquabacter cavernae]